MAKVKNKGKKEFVWYGLRISFWVFVIIWALTMILPLDPEGSFFLSLSVLWLILTLFTFVVSIIHLTKYKQKALAIVALVISSIGLVLLLFA
jgi:hypothetical protein